MFARPRSPPIIVCSSRRSRRVQLATTVGRASRGVVRRSDVPDVSGHVQSGRRPTPVASPSFTIVRRCALGRLRHRSADFGATRHDVLAMTSTPFHRSFDGCVYVYVRTHRSTSRTRTCAVHRSTCVQALSSPPVARVVAEFATAMVSCLVR